MCFWQWLVANSGSLLLFLATFVLVIITFRYMKATKRMADVMQQEYERSITPICKPIFQRNSANERAGTFIYVVYNYGKEIFFLEKVKTEIWSENDPATILSSHEEPRSDQIAPLPDQLDLQFTFNFTPVIAEMYSIPIERNKLKWQATFITKDVRNREHETKDSVRSLF